MRNNKEKSLATYLSAGMATGALAGVVIAALSATIWQNIFLAVSGTGFGLCFGLLIADIMWCLKKHR